MADILSNIGTAITAVTGWLVSTLTSVSSMFYDSTNGFTFVGVLLLVGFGLGLVWTLIKFVKALVRRG